MRSSNSSSCAHASAYLAPRATRRIGAIMDDIEIEETRRCPVSRQVRYHGPEHHLTFAKLGSKGACEAG